MIRASRFSALCAVLLLAGCNILPPPTEDMTRFYVLNTETPASSIPSTGLTVGIRPVEIAAYLQHRDIVVRDGQNEVVYKDLSRWAEPIEEGVARIVSSKLLGSDKVTHVYQTPFPLDTPRDFDVTINVIRCEGAKLGGAFVAQFSAVVEIHKHSDNGETRGARVVFKATDKPWDGHDYGALVALLSQDSEELGQSVVDSVAAQH